MGKSQKKKNAQNKGEKTDTRVVGGFKVTDNRKSKEVDEPKPEHRESSNETASLSRRQKKNKKLTGRHGDCKEEPETTSLDGAAKAAEDFTAMAVKSEQIGEDDIFEDATQRPEEEKWGAGAALKSPEMIVVDDAEEESPVIDSWNCNANNPRSQQGYGRGRGFKNHKHDAGRDPKGSFYGGRDDDKFKNNRTKRNGDATHRSEKTVAVTSDRTGEKFYEFQTHRVHGGRGRGNKNSDFKDNLYGRANDQTKKHPNDRDGSRETDRNWGSRRSADSKEHNRGEFESRRFYGGRDDSNKRGDRNRQNYEAKDGRTEGKWDSDVEKRDDDDDNWESKDYSGGNLSLTVPSDNENRFAKGNETFDDIQLGCSESDSQNAGWNVTTWRGDGTSPHGTPKPFKDDSASGKWRVSEGRENRSSSSKNKTSVDWDDYRNDNYSYRRGDDDEFEAYGKFMRLRCEHVKVKEIERDLFSMSDEYCLAHCVAEDMNMGSGIAVQFSQQFKRRSELYDQRQKQGGLAVLEDKGRFIYYLVTKRESNGKPTLHTMFSSIQKLQRHVDENKVKKLAIPRIGCGLDRLKWSDVKGMLEFAFRDTNVEITVCNFQQPEPDQPSPVTSPPRSVKGVYVKHVAYPLVDIEGGTAIVYLGTTDNHVSEELEKLNAKFDIVGDYKNSNKKVGDVLVHYKQNKSYGLYGFIVNETKKDPFNFITFNSCVVSMNKMNKKFYEYVGFQAFIDENDDLLMSKIVNILKYGLHKVDVYICWGGKVLSYMPSSRDRDL